MRLMAKAIRISHAKFHCNRLTTVQGIDKKLRECLIYLAHIVRNIKHDPCKQCQAMSSL